MRRSVTIVERVEREREHAANILDLNESNWGWNTAAGDLRRRRRAAFLTRPVGHTTVSPRVLEVGCGTGTFTGDLAAAFPSLTSTDISQALLRKAAEKFPRVQFQRQDI